jgi:hypothetical protein
MAAIEKVCELTGEYPSHKMYSFKRNQLQITPQARIQFRGAGDTLFVEKPKLVWVSKLGTILDFDPQEVNNYHPPFNNLSEFIEYKRAVNKERLLKSYQYAFLTNSPRLQGDVEGVYFNSSTKLSTVRRKIKRLLRCKKLNLVFVDNLSSELPRLREII